MYFSILRTVDETGRQCVSKMDFNQFAQRIQQPAKAQHIAAYRERYLLQPSAFSSSDGADVAQLDLGCATFVHPAFLFSRNRDGLISRKHYNGIIVLETLPLASTEKAEKVRKAVSQQPQTIAAFLGIDAHSVKILMRATLPNGDLPQTPNDIQCFHTHAWQWGVRVYAPLVEHCGGRLSLRNAALSQQRFLLSADAAAFFRTDAVPFILQQPHQMPQPLTETPDSNRPATAQLSPLMAQRRFQLLLNELLRKQAEHLSDEQLLPLLGEACCADGLAEEETIHQAQCFFHRLEPDYVRCVLHNVYDRSCTPTNAIGLNRLQEIALRLEEFMQRRYEVRFNTLLGQLEYRCRHSSQLHFSPVDEHMQSTMELEAQKEGINLLSPDMTRYLRARPLHFNPVQHYFDHLPQWDGKERIAQLAQRIPCNNPRWSQLFRRWLLGMVAHWLHFDERHGNQISPLLVGTQGCHKSTFCNQLLPPELRIAYTDSLDLTSRRDAALALNRYLLINIDEFDQYRESQQAHIKYLLQAPSISVRRPYATTAVTLPRYASFIGTSNRTDLLTDPTGSRRFICVNITAPIDVETPIHYEQLYAELLHALYHRERYWLDTSEETYVQEQNQSFEQLPYAVQLFQAYFRQPTPSETGEWLTPTHIIERLQKYSRIAIPMGQINNFGRYLQKMKLENRRTRTSRLYYVVEGSPEVS